MPQQRLPDRALEWCAVQIERGAETRSVRHRNRRRVRQPCARAADRHRLQEPSASPGGPSGRRTRHRPTRARCARAASRRAGMPSAAGASGGGSASASRSSWCRFVPDGRQAVPQPQHRIAAPRSPGLGCGVGSAPLQRWASAASRRPARAAQAAAARCAPRRRRAERHPASRARASRCSARSTARCRAARTGRRSAAAPLHRPSASGCSVGPARGQCRDRRGAAADDAEAGDRVDAERRQPLGARKPARSDRARASATAAPCAATSRHAIVRAAATLTC